MPVLVRKFEASVNAYFKPKQAERVRGLFSDVGAGQAAKLDALPVNELMAALVTNDAGATAP
jgi:hypothetical protein